MPPRISVVVSTHDRPDRLARLLDGLAAQTLDRADWELVVVDDGSGPATLRLLTDRVAAGDLPLAVLSTPRRLGAAAGRNLGWRAARGPLVAFTDDDCVPDPGWLTALLSAAAAEPGAVVQGRTAPDSAGLAAVDGRLLFARTIDVRTANLRYETCNIAYPRDLLERLDGFDESYTGRPGGEDTDLGWRARELGVPLSFASDANVLHDVTDLGPRGKLVNATRWGVCGRTFARHPAARVILDRDVFWNVWHYLLVRTLIVVLAPLPATLRRVVVARHLSVLITRARALGATPAAIPFLLTQDTIELVVMLRASLAHRTLLL